MQNNNALFTEERALMIILVVNYRRENFIAFNKICKIYLRNNTLSNPPFASEILKYQCKTQPNSFLVMETRQNLPDIMLWL